MAHEIKDTNLDVYPIIKIIIITGIIVIINSYFKD